ncbi:hypothetical protein OsJ_06588 [Oryza sativa Japonica Group]|uniref:Uncharacterized protein n=1 Tax=Oryza sativa subsp. japonica TaxID=39947 RepID=B9EZS1_ORYSJ|nr:hypothetical protein OsJ_06588 [Oryza sativa Japonica Group]
MATYIKSSEHNEFIVAIEAPGEGSTFEEECKVQVKDCSIAQNQILVEKTNGTNEKGSEEYGWINSYAELLRGDGMEQNIFDTTWNFGFSANFDGR